MSPDKKYKKFNMKSLVGRFTFGSGDMNAPNPVLRCMDCNKFMSWKKYILNNYKCYHKNRGNTQCI